MVGSAVLFVHDNPDYTKCMLKGQKKTVLRLHFVKVSKKQAQGMLSVRGSPKQGFSPGVSL